jgi:hypothetical protein
MAKSSKQASAPVQIIAVVQDRALSDFAKRLSALAEEGPVLLADILNAEGEAIRAATVEAETVQTGLPEATMNRAQQTIDAAPGRLQFTIVSRGGNVRLKYFHAAEGGGGVTATPWGRPTSFPGAFLTSGRPGARFMVKELNGQVYIRATPSTRWNERRDGFKKHKSMIVQERSGLFIPTEMVKGPTAKAFEDMAVVAATHIVSRLGSLLAA